jgi:hypothetical protein
MSLPKDVSLGKMCHLDQTSCVESVLKVCGLKACGLKACGLKVCGRSVEDLLKTC